MENKELKAIIKAIGDMNLLAKDGRHFEGIQLKFKIIQEIKKVDELFVKNVGEVSE